jgi:uncharacterized protein YjeT (DUF2065 family)
MTEFITAIGLVLVIEGLLYALAPRGVKQMMAAMDKIPPDTLRTGGLAAAALGVFIVWLARSLAAGS